MADEGSNDFAAHVESGGLGKELRTRLASIEKKLEAISAQLGSAAPRPAPVSSKVARRRVGSGAFYWDEPDEYPGRETAFSLTAECWNTPTQPGVPQTFVEEIGDIEEDSENGNRTHQEYSDPSWQSGSKSRLPRDSATSVRPSMTDMTSMSSIGAVRANTFERVDGWEAGERRRNNWVRIQVSRLEETPIGGCFACLDRFRRRSLGAEKPPYFFWVHNNAFELVTCFLIIINAVFVGLSGTAQLRTNAFGESPVDWIENVEVGFCIVFACELLLRLWAERPLRFCLGDHWMWNGLDSFIVASSAADALMSGIDSGAVDTVTIGRLLRLSRFIRLLRMTRVMRHFTNLKVIVYAIVHSLDSLFWCFAVVIFIIYMYAVLLVFGLAEYFRVGAAGDDTTDLRTWYGGGVFDIVISLFMAICGGLDWKIAYDHWKQVHDVYGWIMLSYIFVMQFGVLNVVVATFVRATMDIVSKDKDGAIQQQADDMEDYIQKVTQFFNEADVDSTGNLTWDEFRTHMQKSHVKAFFASLDLDITQAHHLFELLDVDGDAQVSLEEFLTGCMRLRGKASNVDLNVVLLQTERLHAQMNGLRKRSHQQLDILKDIKRRGLA